MQRSLAFIYRPSQISLRRLVFYCPPTRLARAPFVFILETINCEIAKAKRKSATSEPNDAIDDS